MVLQGSLLEFCDGQSRVVTPGTVFFLPPGWVHAGRIHGVGASCFEIRLEPRWLQRLEGGSLALDAPAHFPSGPLGALVIRLRDEVRETDGASRLIAEGLALELLGEIARRRAPVAERWRPRWLRQARELLETRFAESLSLEEIAAAVGVHPAHLASAFRAQYGCTVGDCVRRLRIDHACREIVRSKAPLAEIAFDAGFANQSHFSRVFKRLTGLTPAEYRRAFSSP
jgi:AraC family transcriptional regulator